MFQRVRFWEVYVWDGEKNWLESSLAEKLAVPVFVLSEVRGDFSTSFLLKFSGGRSVDRISTKVCSEFYEM